MNQASDGLSQPPQIRPDVAKTGENLLFGMSLVVVVLLIFLGHTRAAIITALNIPIALLIAFIGLVTTGTPAK